MPPTVLGLPVHPLVVHAAVVLVPLASLLLIGAALSPRLRRWAGWLTPGLATLALVLVPLATSSGENLEGAVGESQLVQAHAELADQLLPWAIAVAVLSYALTWWDRRRPGAAARARGSRGLATALTVLAVVAGLGATVEIALIGHSGAKAVWSQKVGGSSPQGGGDGD